ncbi:MAG: DUF3703 domain-containing protein [Flavobacteriaceae bacterium]
MAKKQMRKEYNNQINLGKEFLAKENFNKAYYHFENAHILGQKHLLKHIRSHYYMLLWGIHLRDTKEIIGQIFRIIASFLFTLFWVPKGNTGGTNISPIKQIPIRKELKKYFSK